MSITDGLREQHQEIFQVVNKIKEAMQDELLLNNADSMRYFITMLCENIKVHLIMEDEALYPSLFDHTNQEVRKKAKKFAKDMGGLKDDVMQYAEKWLVFGKIENNLKEFKKETRDIFNELETRIKKEDEELYKLLDDADK